MPFFHTLSQKGQGLILAILAYSIFAFTDVCLKVTTAVYDPFEVGLYMNLFTITFMIPVIFYCGGFKKTMATKSFKFHFLRSGLMLINFICIIYALSILPITTLYVVIFCMPFILNILAVLFLKEHISIHRWISIGIGFIGVLIALRPGYTPLGLGIIAVATGTFLLAFASICIRYINKKDHWLSYTIYLMGLQTPVLAAIVLYRGGSLLPDFTDITTIPWFTAGGIFYVAALSFIPQAYQKIDASIAGALIYLVFPWGIVYGYFIFGDVADLWTLVGAAIIIAGGLYLIYREKIEDSKLTKLEEHKDHGTTH
jgi:drug/metabolite transporter (DMT)-like permease